MWPYQTSTHDQSSSADQGKYSPTYKYDRTHHPSAFQPPTAHHVLSLPTTRHPGYSSYNSNPFAPKPSGPTQVQNPSAFYQSPHYRDEANVHPSTLDSAASRTATPQPHVQFQPSFGVAGFRAPVHELAYKPFVQPFSTPTPPPEQQGGGVSLQNRPFGYQPRPAFPGAMFHPRSRLNAAESRKRGVLLPSEKVRAKLYGVEEEEEEDEVASGLSGPSKKRKRSLTPSQKVRKRLEGLGPREAWDPDSP